MAMKVVLICIVLAFIAITGTAKKNRKSLCKIPEIPGNATVRYRKFIKGKITKVGSKILFACKKGFVRRGARKIKCLKSGKWTSQPPTCEVGRCRKPYALKFLRNGIYKVDDENMKYLSTITIICNESYSISSSVSDAMTCVQNDDGNMVWQPRYVPRCYPIRCSDPGPPEDGAMGGTDRRIGSKVRFFCHSGYKLIGDEVRTCQSNGLWSGHQPVCDKGETDCINPGKPANGRRIGNGFNVGDEVRYECSTGYALFGSETRKCKEDGNWTGIPVTCEDSNKIFIPSLNETASFLSSNLIEVLSPNACQTDDEGKCVRKVVRGRSINIDHPNGLDLIFMIDSSSSVGERNFPLALRFTNHIIKQFGVDYGPGGVRIAAITFNTQAELVYNLGDSEVDTVRKAKDMTKKIVYRGGGTATRSALKLILDAVPLEKTRAKALIIITDGKHNVEGNPIDLAEKLRVKYGVKIYAIGIGKVNKDELSLLVGQENRGHIFRLEKFGDFPKIIEKLIHRDYSGCGEGSIQPNGRILGGAEAQGNTWPWTVAIYTFRKDRYVFTCGGSLIKEDVIVTAAHCFEEITVLGRKPRLETSSYRVVVGKKDIKRTKFSDPSDKEKKEVNDWIDAVGYKVQAIYVYPDFKHGKGNMDDYNDDIALIQMDRPVKWSPRIRPICLPSQEDYLKEPSSKKERISGHVAGWGKTSIEPKVIGQTKLKFVQLKVNSNKTCSNTHFSSEKMFCAGNKDGRRDACKGDSGGPFAIRLPANEDEKVFKFKLIGVVSWGPPCGDKTMYGYYTRVNNYLDWIKKTIDDMIIG